MEARLYRVAALLAAIVSLNANIALGASSRTANFIVEAPTPELAEKIGKAAETYRRDLAVLWLGAPMPNWTRPCPIVAQVAPNLGAGGQTSFVFDRVNGSDEVFGWDMRIQGSEQRVLDSVLPHEVTHTIFACHFRRPLPRWADEGACTTVEHVSERNKQQVMLVKFLRTNHGIAFDKMFAMKDYPPDVLPLYSQGYSLARFLIDQGGRQKFLQFVGDGMKNENWSTTVNKHYGFANLQSLQDGWLDWVKQGSPSLNSRPSSEVLAANDRTSQPAAEPQYRAQSDDRATASLSSKAALATATGDNSDRGWTPANTAGSSRDGFGAPARSGDSPRVAMNDTSPAASRASVYDRRTANAAPPAAGSAAAMPPPAPVPAVPSAEAPPRGQEFVALRDPVADPPRGRQVLLEWKRPE